MKIDQVLIKPKITEKGMLKTKEGVYFFEVNPQATKNQVKEAVEKLFKVEVKEVKILLRKGKVRRAGRRLKEKRMSDQKLAYIKLAKGKIDLFPQT